MSGPIIQMCEVYIRPSSQKISHRYSPGCIYGCQTTDYTTNYNNYKFTTYLKRRLIVVWFEYISHWSVRNLLASRSVMQVQPL